VDQERKATPEEQQAAALLQYSLEQYPNDPETAAKFVRFVTMMQPELAEPVKNLLRELESKKQDQVKDASPSVRPRPDAGDRTGKTESESERSMDAKKAAVNEDRFKNTDIGIIREGSKIVLPNNPHEMTYDEGIQALIRIKEQENMKVAVHEVVDAYPFDGAIAFMKAMKQQYGWASAVPTPGFWGDTPPTTVSVPVGHDSTAQVIWGSFEVPGIEGRLETGMTGKEGRPVFVIKGEIKKKNQAAIGALAELTRKYAREQSIYRGKAVRITTDEDGDLQGNEAPKFLDVTKVNFNELTFSEEVMTQIQTNLFTPIQHTKRCRELGIPLKRGVLLEGKYGTGKTLTAFCAAQLCEQNGWTFILLDKVAGLKDALKFARMYSPAVVFAEDIDRSVTGERSISMDDILNTIDGIESKGSEILTILTSNHVENINKAMLRPGRLDAVISVHAPDAKAVEKLIRIYARNRIATDADLTKAGKALDGQIPAVIREAVERAKLYAISRNPSDENILLTDDDFAAAANGMKGHLELMAPKAPVVTLEARFASSFRELVNEGVKSNGVYEKVSEIHEHVINN
jgi:transitional endoplasmic reticulum ATPase